MDFGRAFTFAFEDADWLKKLGIAALVFLIPVVGSIIVMGWSLEITRRVIAGDSQPLPGWDDFGSYVSKGFQAFVVTLAYVLPLILVAICGQVAVFGATAALGSNGNGDTAGAIATIVGLCMTCLVIILSIGAGVLVPPALGNLAATGELGAAFRFNEVFGLLRAAPGPYILSILILGLTAVVISPIGALILVIGALATSAYISALSGHLYGQAYNAAKAVKTPAM